MYSFVVFVSIVIHVKNAFLGLFGSAELCPLPPPPRGLPRFLLPLGGMGLLTLLAGDGSAV
jgi:hypothetical protein